MFQNTGNRVSKNLKFKIFPGEHALTLLEGFFCILKFFCITPFMIQFNSFLGSDPTSIAFSYDNPVYLLFLFCQLKALSLVKQKGSIEKEDPNAVRKKLSPKAQEEIQKKAFEDSSKGMPIKRWSPENF